MTEGWKKRSGARRNIVFSRRRYAIKGIWYGDLTGFAHDFWRNEDHNLGFELLFFDRLEQSTHPRDIAQVGNLAQSIHRLPLGQSADDDCLSIGNFDRCIDFAAIDQRIRIVGRIIGRINRFQIFADFCLLDMNGDVVPAHGRCDRHRNARFHFLDILAEDQLCLSRGGCGLLLRAEIGLASDRDFCLLADRKSVV